MNHTLVALPLLLPLLLLLLPAPLAAHVEVIARPPGSGAGGRQLLATNECVAKGLQGTCNGCVVSGGGAGACRRVRQSAASYPW